MKRIGLGCLVIVGVVLLVGLCFGLFDDDEAEIEVEEVGVGEVWRAA